MPSCYLDDIAVLEADLSATCNVAAPVIETVILGAEQSGPAQLQAGVSDTEWLSTTDN